MFGLNKKANEATPEMKELERAVRYEMGSYRTLEWAKKWNEMAKKYNALVEATGKGLKKVYFNSDLKETTREEEAVFEVEIAETENAIIEELRQLGFDNDQIKEALCDGEFLSNESWTQEEVEEAYNKL